MLDAELPLSIKQDLESIIRGEDVDDMPLLMQTEWQSSIPGSAVYHTDHKFLLFTGVSGSRIPHFYEMSVEEFLGVRGIAVLPEHAEAFKELKAQYHDKQCEILDEELGRNPVADETKFGRRKLLIDAKKQVEHVYSRAQENGADLWAGRYQDWDRQRTRYNLARKVDLPDDMRLPFIQHEGEGTKERRLSQFQDLVYDMDTAFNYVSSLRGTSEPADAFVALVDCVRNDIRLAQAAYEGEDPAKTSPGSLEKIWMIAALASNSKSKSLPEHIKTASSLMAKGKIDPEALGLLADSLQLVSEKLQKARVRGVDDARLCVEVAAEVLTAQVKSYGFDRMLTPDRAAKFLEDLDAVLAQHDINIEEASDGLTRAVKELCDQVVYDSDSDASARAQNDGLQVGLEVLKGQLQELVV